jgi:hypothetical protein
MAVKTSSLRIEWRPGAQKPFGLVVRSLPQIRNNYHAIHLILLAFDIPRVPRELFGRIGEKRARRYGFSAGFA